jgi:hypothetical protein
VMEVAVCTLEIDCFSRRSSLIATAASIRSMIFVDEARAEFGGCAF